MTSRQSRILSVAAMILLLVSLSSCISLKMLSVDRKTQLENQILGTFEQLDQDLLLVSSVRGASEDKARMTPEQREAAMSQMNRMFRKDDVDSVKADGVAGENKDGTLTFLPNQKTQKDAEYRDFANRTIAEENKDRKVIMNRVISMNVNLSKSDLPVIQEMFFALMVQNSPVGTKVWDVDNNAWMDKTEQQQ